jgi:hypothetical protein
MPIKQDLPSLFQLDKYTNIECPTNDRITATWKDGPKEINLRFNRHMEGWDFPSLSIEAQNPKEKDSEWITIWQWSADKDAKALWQALSDKAFHASMHKRDAFRNYALAVMEQK